MNGYATLFSELPTSVTVLTPNQRLSAYLRKQHQATQTTPVFNTLDVLPVQAWLHRIYEFALTQQWIDKIALTTEQTVFLWERILQQEPTANTLLAKPHKTAQLAQSAWDLFHAWQIPLSQLKDSHHHETELFLSWITSFQAALKQHQWITPSELPLYLAQHLPRDYCHTLSPHYLVGFDEMPSHLNTLFSKLEQQGVSIKRWDENPDVTHTRPDTIACENPVEEFERALSYAKDIVENDQNARVAIVVPDLKTHRNTLVSVSQKLFYPNDSLLEPETNEWVNISGGIPLKNTLLIQSIFTALTLQPQNIALSDVYWIWHSPYFNFQEYDKGRPLLRSLLCQKYPKYLSHTSLMRFLQTQLSLKESKFPSFYTALKAPPGHNPNYKTHEAWVHIIHRYLLDLGFPGNRVLKSSEVQCLKAWEEVLNTFSALDTIDHKVSFEDAMTQLEYLCQQKLFQAKTKDTPIQILGLLEASGLTYTHLWITGLNEGILPSHPRPNPLLPVHLQRKWRMPHADITREFQFAQKILARLFSYSDHAICSYSEKNETVLLRKSALINTFPTLNKSVLNKIRSIPLKTEWVSDQYGLGLDANIPVEGGSTLFKLQAQCPFKAYATLRLKAKEITTPGLGFSPALRGSLVHRALEYFYQVISSQSQWMSLSTKEQHALLQHACSKALTHFHEEHPLSEHSHYYDLEFTRLQKLLENWLEHEKLRPHFEVIATEKRLEAHFSGLRFNIQIDRIDRLDDGTEIIIDYKTGSVSLDDWFSERPNEPQLPLYCILYENNVKAMAFAKIHPQKMEIEGVGMVDETWAAISRKRLIFTKIEGADPWEKQRNVWREQLSALAEEFKMGYAAVSPKEGSHTCQYCHLPSLCRIRQQTLEEIHHDTEP